MKNMKKLFSLLLAIVMVMGLAVSASADMEGTLTGGSITINDAVKGQTYSAYQILYLESYDSTTGAYAYKANSAWADWLATQTAYVSIDDQGYVTWVDDASAADFAKLAQAQLSGKTADATQKAESTTVTLSGLKLGYYLVDTTLGTLCSLDTTNPNVTMEEKNEAPTVEKKVQEDSTNAWGDTNDADINQVVNYQATVTVKAGAENYVLYDNMSDGLTFNNDVTVTVGSETVSTDNYTVKTDVTGYTFVVEFKNSWIETLTVDTKIVASYSATLNENAVVGLDGNPNEVILKYGDENKPSWTPKDETITYTWDMDILKYGNGDETKVLSGAKFVLLNSNKNAVAQVTKGKLAKWVTITDDINLADYALITDKDGKIAIDGLDADTYYLREIEAPTGYNKLSDDIEVKVTAASADTEDSDKDGDTTELVYTTVVAKVNNQSGTELPSTGGMGTTIFYTLGGILVVAAVVLLVTKRRMNSAE